MIFFKLSLKTDASQTFNTLHPRQQRTYIHKKKRTDLPCTPGKDCQLNRALYPLIGKSFNSLIINQSINHLVMRSLSY